MGCEISISDSKIKSNVIAKIKSYWPAQTKLNGWLQIADWKKPADTWYNQVSNTTMIEIKTLHNAQPDHHFVVVFEGVPKATGQKLLMASVGTLPFKKP